MSATSVVLDSQKIETRILMLRSQRVILDVDLSSLYGVTTKRLNEQVKRNKERFPSDFMFQLTSSEKHEVVTKYDHLASLKYSRTSPYAFTEHGVIMAANVLDSPQAVEVSLFIVRTFIRLRQLFALNKELRHKLIEVERKIQDHDEAIRDLIQTIRHLMDPPNPVKKRPIGFVHWPEK